MQNQTREYNVWLLGLSGGRDLFDYCTALDLGDFKLGKDDNPVWVGNSSKIISGGTVIFNLSDLNVIKRILKTECKKETF